MKHSEEDIERVNPFADEFSVRNVANRPIELDYDEFKRLEDGEKDAVVPLLSANEINEIIIESPKSRISKQSKENLIYEQYTEQNQGGDTLIKANKAENIKEFTSEELVPKDLEVPESSKEDVSRDYLELDTETVEVNPKINENIEQELNLFESTDFIDRNENRQQKTFIDYVKSPRISGDHTKRTSNNLYPSEYIEHNSETVEILDTPNFSGLERENSMIEINRDNDGEIVSIIVYCKCGEKTVIKLDYYDPDMADESEKYNIEEYQTEKLSDIVNDDMKPDPDLFFENPTETES